MAETLLDKVSGILLKGESIKDFDFSKYQMKVQLSASDCCYGADCGDCTDGEGYCIDSDNRYLNGRI